MGHEAVHPDEPEPWVYSIGVDEVTVPARPPSVGTLLGASNGRAESATTRTMGAAGHSNGAGGHSTGAEGNGTGAEGNGTGPAREARPMRAPGLTDDGAEDDAGDAESLLRELHSLAALDNALVEQERGPVGGARNGHASRGAPGSSAAAPPPLPTDATPRAPEAVTPPRPTRGDPSAIADAFAELSALDLPASTSARGGAVPPDPGTTTPHAATGAAGPTPPEVPIERRNPTDAAGTNGGGGLSALFSEGPLFGSGDEPPPAPDHAHELAGDGSAGDALEPTPDQEYEATLHVVASPGRSQRSTRRRGPGSRTNGSSPQHVVPPPVPDLQPEAADEAGPATNGHRVLTPDTGTTLDLSSFTARGGPGARKAGGRRRRLAR
jgi:hypothetical protein